MRATAQDLIDELCEFVFNTIDTQPDQDAGNKAREIYNKIYPIIKESLKDWD